MNAKRIQNYWSRFFNCPSACFSQKGFQVIAHAELSDFQGSWIFRIHECVLISVPATMVPIVQNRLDELPQDPTQVFSPDWFQALFPVPIAKIIGPVYQGYYMGRAPAHTTDTLRSIHLDRDASHISKWAVAADPAGWNDGGLSDKTASAVGVWDKGALGAVASYKMIAPAVAFINIFTHPAYRAKGLGTEAVRAILHEIGNKGYLARYQTLAANFASVAIASKLGIQPFGEHIALRFG